VDKKIFVSVGKTSTAEQEEFVRSIEDRLRGEGLNPCTVGRNTFTAGAPLKKVSELMSECSGAVVIAFERTYFPFGTDRRGNSAAAELRDVRLPTPWNQIEAAMAYCHQRPLLIIVEEGIREEGLLERGNDWYVQRVPISKSALSTVEFNGILASWKDKMLSDSVLVNKSKPAVDSSQLTIGQIIGALRPAQLWSFLVAIAALLAGAFSLGAKLFGGS